MERFKYMTKDIREKIIKFQGWDRCIHNDIRLYCEDCKYDVPSYIRDRQAKGLKAVPVTEQHE